MISKDERIRMEAQARNKIARAILRLKRKLVTEVTIADGQGGAVTVPMDVLRHWSNLQLAMSKGGQRGKRPPEKFDKASVANRERVRRFRERQKARASKAE